MSPDRWSGIGCERIKYKYQAGVAGQELFDLFNSFPPNTEHFGVEISFRDCSEFPVLTSSGRETVIDFEPTPAEQWTASDAVKKMIAEITNPRELKTSVILGAVCDLEGHRGEFAVLFGPKKMNPDSATLGFSNNPNLEVFVSSFEENGNGVMPPVLEEYRSLTPSDTRVLQLLAEGAIWLETVLRERLMIMSEGTVQPQAEDEGFKVISLPLPDNRVA